MAKLETKRAKVQEKIERLLTKYLDPDTGLTKAEFLRRRGELEASLAALDREIAWGPALEPLPGQEEWVEFEASARQALTEGTEDISARRSVLQAFGLKVWVDPTTGVVARLEGSYMPERLRSGLSALMG